MTQEAAIQLGTAKALKLRKDVNVYRMHDGVWHITVKAPPRGVISYRLPFFTVYYSEAVLSESANGKETDGIIDDGASRRQA